ncbi:putative uridine nucleosidase 2 [Cytospora mali]|uniref:Uridine nucleosidase 2 n=1 Tax=Cytospora mali TaxID=578113 RepID=A0A194UUA2_CYTMA|nr:putative uridine nucleosidase 2 [Valsa mali var. pyri (nom. inval.)]
MPSIPVLIDTDPGIDDSVAILFALLSPNLSIEAITTVSGSLTADICSRNARKVLDLSSNPRAKEITVSRGPLAPICRPYPKDPFSHGADGLGELGLKDSLLKERVWGGVIDRRIFGYLITYHSPPSPPLSQLQFSSSSHKSPANGLDPVLTQDWSPVKLLEEYDPNNLEEVSRPYAYVADHVQRIDSSCSVAEEIAKYEQQVRSKPDAAMKGPNGEWETAKRPGWFGQLRDQLQRDEEIKWYVVVNGDEERAWPVDGAGSRPETRAQTVHHERYTHQQITFEDQDRDIEMRRQELRRELGYEESGIGNSVDGTLETKPEVPETESTELPPDSPVPPAAAPRPKTSKTPVKTFKRFFGRLKTGDTS